MTKHFTYLQRTLNIPNFTICAFISLAIFVYNDPIDSYTVEPFHRKLYYNDIALFDKGINYETCAVNIYGRSGMIGFEIIWLATRPDFAQVYFLMISNNY